MPGEASVWLAQLLSSLGHEELLPKHSYSHMRNVQVQAGVTGTDSPVFYSIARQTAGVQKGEVATTNEPCWCNDYKILYCFLIDNDWKCKYSHSTLKIAPCSQEAAPAFEDFSPWKALRTTHPTPPTFLPTLRPSALHFTYFFFSLFKRRLKALKEKRQKGTLVLPTDHGLDFFILGTQVVN